MSTFYELIGDDYIYNSLLTFELNSHIIYYIIMATIYNLYIALMEYIF